MSRRRYVWRVTSQFTEHYSDGRPWRQWTQVRHYHSRSAAQHHAAVLLGAVEPVNPEVAWLPRAESVVIERSAPVDGWELVAS